jgi:molybdate transport system regulatory protein
LRQDGKVKPVPHISLQSEKRTILDEKDGFLLQRIYETSSLALAARQSRISYRNAWDRIKRIEDRCGKSIVSTRSGGTAGGGSRLTPAGKALLKEFRMMTRYLNNALEDREASASVRYRLSARNLIGAKIDEIERGDITSLVRMTANPGVSLTSIISNDAVDDLGLHEGDKVDAVIKSTDVMIAKKSPPH